MMVKMCTTELLVFSTTVYLNTIKTSRSIQSDKLEDNHLHYERRYSLYILYYIYYRYSKAL